MTDQSTHTPCPNCAGDIDKHLESGCVLGALISVIKDRGEHTEEQLKALTHDCDVDRLWEDLGPIIDSLASGAYSS